MTTQTQKNPKTLNPSPVEQLYSFADERVPSFLYSDLSRAVDIKFRNLISEFKNDNVRVHISTRVGRYFDATEWADNATILFGSSETLHYDSNLAKSPSCETLVPKPMLVGIEMNPGPKVSERATDFKRSKTEIPYYLKAKKNFLSHKRQQEKLMQQRINESRDQKYAPEGLFDVKIDLETRQFLTELFQSFSHQMSDVRMSHIFSLSPPEIVTQFFKWIQDVSKEISKVIIGCYKLVVAYLPQRIRNFFNSIAAFIYPEAVIEDDVFEDALSSFQPEMSILDMQFPKTAFFASLYASNFAQAFEEGSWLRLISTLAEVKKATVTGNSALSTVTSVLREVIVFLNDSFNLQIPGFFEPTEIEPLLVRMRTYQSEYRNGITTEYDFASKVFTLQDEMETMLYSKRQTLEPIVKERLTYMLRKFQPIVNYCEKNINPNNGPRVEPLAMMIAGASGVGKSTITVPFLLALMSKILPSESKAEFMKNHNDFIFFRANENEFWDGYKSRNIAIVYDDFGQQKDTAGNPNPDAFELIRLKNTAPYHLHFASIEDKQRNFASPKLIFATSNRSRLHFESIMCNEAVIRRFDLAFVQAPKLAYCVDSPDSSPFSRKLDLEKVRKDYPYDVSKPETFAALQVIEFIEWDFYTGEQLKGGRVLNFDQFLKESIRLYIHLNTKGDAMLAFHEYMKTYQPEMGDIFHECEKPKQKTMIEMLNDFCSTASNKWLKYQPSLEDAAVISQAVGAMVLAYKGFKALGSMYSLLFGDSRKAEIYSPRKEHVKNSKSRAKRSFNRMNKQPSQHRVKTVPEAAVQNLDSYLATYKRNVYNVEIRGVKVGSCLFIAGSSFIWPRHFTDKILSFEDDGVKDWEEIISFVDPVSNRCSFKLDFNADIDFCNLEGNYDLSFCHVSNNKIRQHSNISQMFFSGKERSKLDSSYSAQMIVKRTDTLVALDMKLSISGDVSYVGTGITYSSRGMLYSAPTALGDCGAFILINDTRFPAPRICGIHTAGDTGGVLKTKNCAGVIVYREEIEEYLELFANNEYVEETCTNMVPESKVINGFKVLATAKMPRMPTETSIVQSPLASYLWPTTTKPAHLKPFMREGVLVKPGEIARKTYSHDEVYIDSSVLHIATALVTNLVLQRNVSAPHEPRTYTFDEAVSGIDGLDFVDSINRSTSAGYPYVLETKSKGKTEWFGADGKIDFESPKSLEMKSNVGLILSNAKSGKRMNHIFVDYLKDERRPNAKVDIGKTRQIMTCPVDLLIAFKMYFGDFIRHIMENRIHNGIAIGIDPFSEWDSLAQYLKPSTDYVMTAGDYSGYDGRIPVPIGLACLEVIRSFYTGCSVEDDLVRTVLFQEIINSRHLAEGLVYEFVGGNPSGQPLTSVFNSVCNLLILSYSGACLARNFGEDFSPVFARTRFAVFGDDNVIGYQTQDGKYWDQQILEGVIPMTVGMSYTVETKDGSNKSRRSLGEVQFLKRGFNYFDGVWHSPLEISVLKETLSWERKDATRDQMIERIEANLSELAMHGKRVFAECTTKIVDASIKGLSYYPVNSKFEVAIKSTLTLAQ